VTIAVLGAGSWGTTLATLLAGNGHDVRLWARRADQAAEMKRTRANARYLPGVELPETLLITGAMDAALSGAEMVVLAVPSHTVRELCEAHPFPSGALIVNTAKGLEEGTLERLSEVVVEATGAGPERVLALLGPSHAEEVSRRIPTSVVVAGTDPAARVSVQEAYSNGYFRVYTNDDLVGVEVVTALKNVIAIAAGIIDGLGFGDNTKAALVTRGLAEISRLGSAMGARADTFAGLAGVGDLVVTCLSRHSRNRRLGEMVGGGKSLDEALAEMVMVAEGVRTTRAAVALGRRHAVELPIIETVHAVLFDGQDPREAVGALMTRPLRGEAAAPDEQPDRRS
jgi:glycerol-3-phosphate dehydrogenase (NAD(P)+)